MRFTQREATLYAALVDPPGVGVFSLPAVAPAAVRGVRLLGETGPLECADDGGQLQVRLPDRVPVSPVHVLAIDGDAESLARGS